MRPRYAGKSVLMLLAVLALGACERRESNMVTIDGAFMWQNEDVVALVDPISVLVSATALPKYRNDHAECLSEGKESKSARINGTLGDVSVRACVAAAFDSLQSNDGPDLTVNAETYRMNRRNDVTGRLLAASDQACEKFTQRLNSFQSGTNFFTGSLATALAGAGAIFTPAGTARAFAGAAGIASGVRAEFNGDLFYQQLVPTLRKAIETARTTARKPIIDGFTSKLDVYPMSVAFSDVIRYNGACSLVAAEATMAASLTLANHPGMAEFNQSQVLANTGRFLLAHPEYTSSDLLNADGTIKTNAAALLKTAQAALPPVVVPTAVPGKPADAVVAINNAASNASKNLIRVLSAITADLTPALTKASTTLDTTVATNTTNLVGTANVVGTTVPGGAQKAFLDAIAAEVKACQAKLAAGTLPSTDATYATLTKRQSAIRTGLSPLLIAVRDSGKAYIAAPTTAAAPYAKSLVDLTTELQTLAAAPACS